MTNGRAVARTKGDRPYILVALLLSGCYAGSGYHFNRFQTAAPLGRGVSMTSLGVALLLSPGPAEERPEDIIPEYRRERKLGRWLEQGSIYFAFRQGLTDQVTWGLGLAQTGLGADIKYAFTGSTMTSGAAVDAFFGLGAFYRAGRTHAGLSVIGSGPLNGHPNTTPYGGLRMAWGNFSSEWAEGKKDRWGLEPFGGIAGLYYAAEYGRLWSFPSGQGHHAIGGAGVLFRQP